MLFSASVIIFVFVCSFLSTPLYFVARPNPQTLDRRRGFSNRATAVMFGATVINFILSSLDTASQLAVLIVLIRRTLILDMDSPLSEKSELVNNATWSVPDVIDTWAGSLAVSTILSPPDPTFNNAWRVVKVLISDFIVIWRAWALILNRRWVVFGPFILWIAAVGEWTFA